MTAKRQHFAIMVVTALAIATCAVADERIKTVVVLMEENRAFDHMVGWLATIHPEVNGLTGGEYNLVNTSDPSSKRVYVNKNGHNVSPDDPCHSFGCVTQQIYGEAKPVGVTGQPTMGGFAANAAAEHHDISNPLSMFTPTTAPVIANLSLEFALFDAWWSDVPGPTFPNRQFVHSATSHGETSDEVPKGGFPQTLIYDHLEAAGLSWTMYYEDSLAWALFLARLRLPGAKSHLKPMAQFYADAAAGTLSNYSFIEPRISTNANGPANSQHPDAAVSAGEQLMKDVYEAVRVSPQWNSLLYIICYDEHGGFYDHVPPPQSGVPSPDGIPSKEGFTFDRLGVRTPAVMISPWIDQGVVVHEASGPTSTSHYTLSSIPATMKRVFELPDFLTARDAWAGTFEWLWSNRTEPRTDCPTTLPPVYDPPSPERLRAERALAVNGKQRQAMEALCELRELEAGCSASVLTQGQVSEFLAFHFEAWLRA